MSTTQQFFASGAGNGFPFCPARVDVDDRGDGEPFGYWTTLGGYKKPDGGSPTEAQIDLSRVNAMKLFWDFYALREGTADLTAVTDRPGWDPELDDIITNITADVPAHMRVCRNTNQYHRYMFWTFDGIAYLSMYVRPNIARFYNAGVFIGYGLSGGHGAPGTSSSGNYAFAGARDGDGAGYGCNVSLRGLVYADITHWSRKEDYCTFSGIPFVGGAYLDVPRPDEEPGDELIVQNDNISANAVNSRYENIQTSITGLDFYAYT